MNLMPMPATDQLPLSEPVYQILLSLADQDLHGYAIIRDVEARTRGDVCLTASTLYAAIARLLDSGVVDERPADDARRRTYRLTTKGRRLLTREAERLARAAEWAVAKRLIPAPRGRS